ncbi:DUF5317 domain-containing protein [Jiangella asiatica]|uniref:DUF5317 domain-containing protein n=1 Tax=Jiangella asiatica TaxID=2530372 RepID=A0A4R5DVA8_9ACTN|nr:DUF5317 domain-containing protein [Jiangella asiatica]TDE14953.1 hypothetical protein E1269_02210 [Jiangella asiatica]
MKTWRSSCSPWPPAWAAGYARGGRLRRLAAAPPVRSRLILTALGLYALGVGGSWVWEPLLPALTALCWFTLGFYAWLNRGHHGARLVALGLAANGLVIMLNGAMPVSATAQERAGVSPTVAEEAPEDNGRIAATGDRTALPWLGKVVPVAFPPRPEVVSPGDIAVAAGCAAALATGMTGRRAVTAGAKRPAAPREPRREPSGPRREPAGPRREPVRRGPRPGPADGPPPPPPDRDEHHTGDSRPGDDDGSERTAARATMDADVTADAKPESPRVTA